MKNWRKFLLSLILLSWSASLLAQQEALLLRGPLKDDITLKKLDGVQVLVFQNGNQFDVIEAGTSGKVNIEVPLGFSYDFKFSREGYVSKILRFDTRNIPTEDKAGGFQIDLDIRLFPMIEGFNTDIMKEPIGVASFVAQENNILFDLKHTERVQSKIKAEFDRLKNLAEDGDKMRKDFDKLMQEGTQKMIEEKYQDAMGKFDGALKLYPKDPDAKAKYDEAKAKYDAMLAAQKKEADYLRLIAEGDNNFNAKNWTAAKKSFTDASALKKEEKYPKEKLFEISKMLDQEAIRAEYDAIIKDADAKFNNKDYAVSIEKYRAAQSKLPGEAYPKDQIAKAQAAIDLMMADAAKREQIEQRFKDLITLGDKNLGEKKYDSALGNFQEASNLKAEEKYPKEKIAEIEKILKDLRNKADNEVLTATNAEKERIDREYAERVKAGDKFFQDSQEEQIPLLESALKEYELASDIKPTEKYPAAKIKAISDLITRLKAEEAVVAHTSDKNAERLRQEEEMKRQREEMERLAEEQRLALLNEEERKRKEKQDALAAEEEARRQRGAFLKADNAEEEAVDAYYREARRIEEDAKYKAMEDKKALYANQSVRQEDRATDRRKEQQDNIDSQKDKLETIHRTGESWQARSAAEMSRDKDQDGKNKGQYSQRADQRNKGAQEKVADQKTAQDQLSTNDRNRQIEVERMKVKQENYTESEELARSKGDTKRASNTAQVNRTKEDIASMEKDGEQVRQVNIQGATEKKLQDEARQRDVRSAAEVRLDSEESKIKSDKRMAQSIGEGKESINEAEIMAVNELRQNTTLMQMEKEKEAAAKRYKTRQELYDLDPGHEKKDDEYTLSEATEALPEGVTETSFEYPRPSRKVIERVVKRGNKVDTYRKIVSKTGIFYFKNDRSITEEIWVRETLKATE